MDKYQRLDIIANGIHAANRINNIHNTRTAEDSDISRQQSRITEISEILKVLADYSPEQHRIQLDEVVNRSNMYINMYRNLKNHFDSNRNQPMGKDTIIRTLDIVKPAVDDNKRLLIDKILQLYEIFYLWPKA